MEIQTDQALLRNYKYNYYSLDWSVLPLLLLIVSCLNSGITTKYNIKSWFLKYTELLISWHRIPSLCIYHEAENSYCTGSCDRKPDERGETHAPPTCGELFTINWRIKISQQKYHI